MSNENISFRVIKTLDGSRRLQVENPDARKRFATFDVTNKSFEDVASELTLAIRGMDIDGIEKRVGFRFEFAGRTYEVCGYTDATPKTRISGAGTGRSSRIEEARPTTISLIDVTEEDDSDDE